MIMKANDIYCDLGFWENLCSIYRDFKDSDIFSNENQKCDHIKKWLCLMLKSESHFDCSLSDFKNSVINNDMSFSLWKKSCNGECKLDFSSGIINKMKSGSSLHMDFNMYNSFFLTENNYETSAKNVGVINICNEKVLVYNPFVSQIESVQLHENNNWRKILNNIRHNNNSMVIIDNYIFKDVNENLYEILDVLLPDKMGTTYYLSIFTLGPGLEKRKEFLEEKIKEIRPNLNVYIEMFESKQDVFHDREIITNYVHVTAGAGFDNFKRNQEAKHMTTIDMSYPYLSNENGRKNKIENTISLCKKYLKTINVFSKNRILR